MPWELKFNNDFIYVLELILFHELQLWREIHSIFIQMMWENKKNEWYEVRQNLMMIVESGSEMASLGNAIKSIAKREEKCWERLEYKASDLIFDDLSDIRKVLMNEKLPL